MVMGDSFWSYSVRLEAAMGSDIFLSQTCTQKWCISSFFTLYKPKFLHFGYLDDLPPSFFNCLHHGPSLVKISDLYTKITFLNFLLSISLNIYISDIWAFCLQLLFNCSPHWPSWVKISDLYQKITHFIIFAPICLNFYILDI